MNLTELIEALDAREREWRQVVAGLMAGGHDVAASQVESCRAELADIIHAAEHAAAGPEHAKWCAGVNAHRTPVCRSPHSVTGHQSCPSGSPCQAEASNGEK
jgi:hypothetical protein